MQETENDPRLTGSDIRIKLMHPWEKTSHQKVLNLISLTTYPFFLLLSTFSIKNFGKGGAANWYFWNVVFSLVQYLYVYERRLCVLITIFWNLDWYHLDDTHNLDYLLSQQHKWPWFDHFLSLQPSLWLILENGYTGDTQPGMGSNQTNDPLLLMGSHLGCKQWYQQRIRQVQMGLREDDYPQGLLGFKLWVKKISTAVSIYIWSIQSIFFQSFSIIIGCKHDKITFHRFHTFQMCEKLGF